MKTNEIKIDKIGLEIVKIHKIGIIRMSISNVTMWVTSKVPTKLSKMRLISEKLPPF